MKRLKTLVFLGSGLALLGVVAYRLLLSDAAKESLRSCMGEVRDAADKVSKLVDKDQFTDDGELHNRERTIADWEQLGY